MLRSLWDWHKRHRNNLENTAGWYCLLLRSVFRKHCSHSFRLFSTATKISFVLLPSSKSGIWHSWHHRKYGNAEFPKASDKAAQLESIEMGNVIGNHLLRWRWPSLEPIFRNPQEEARFNTERCVCFRDQKGIKWIALLGNFSMGRRSWVLPIWAYLSLPSSLSGDVFTSLTCSVCLASYSAPECKVTCLVCHCSLDLISVDWFLVMSGYFSCCNHTEFLGS